MGMRNTNGMAAAYLGYQAAERQQQEDTRRAAENARTQQESVFQEEVRNRQRREWVRADRRQAEDDADLAELQAASNPAVPEPEASASASAGTVSEAGSGSAGIPGTGTPGAEIQGTEPPGAGRPPAVPALPTVSGMPQPRNFNTVLDAQQELLKRRLARGTLSVQDYSSALSSLNRVQSEGIHQALERMAQGDYQGGVDAYNAVGPLSAAGY